VHEFSGYTVAGIAKALRRLGYAEVLWPRLSSAAVTALQQGGLFKFHPGATMDEVLVRLGELHGAEACAALMEEATRSSLEGVVAPLARLYLTFKRGDPGALFERFNDLLRGTARGIEARWLAATPTSGRMEFRYAQQPHAMIAHGWRGALRHVLRFAGVEGEVSVAAPPTDAPGVGLDVRWGR
jgi:hypothetical protein